VAMVHQKPGTFPSFRVNKGTLTDWYFNSQFLVWFSLTPSCFFSFLPAESRCVSVCHLLVINQHPNKQGLWWLQRKKRKEIESERERRRKKKSFLLTSMFHCENPQQPLTSGSS